MSNVRGRVPGGAKARAAEGAEQAKVPEGRVRAILPSWRVAEFRIPRVKDAMRIRELALAEIGVDPTTLSEAAQDEDRRAKALVRVSSAMERVAIRHLLLAVSVQPAEIVYRKPFDEAAVRSSVADVVGAEVAESKVKVTDAAKLIEQRVAAEHQACIDESETARRAHLEVITDYAWDQEAGIVGRLSNAYEGTPEGEDWEHLNTFAGKLINGLKALEAAGAPKAPARPIRPSGGFVT